MRSLLRETNEFFSQFMSPVARKLFYWVAGSFLVYYFLSTLGAGMPVFGILADRVFMLTPYQAVLQANVWQFVTYLFAHANFWHFLFNMFALLFFASPIEELMGGRRFLWFVLLTGIACGIVHCIAGFAFGNPGTSLIGFSGASYAIITAAALYFPRMTVYFFFFPIPMRVLALFFGILVAFDLLGSIASGGLFSGRVSHLAHATGILMAVALVKMPIILNVAEDFRIPLLMRRGPRRVRKSGGRFSMGHPGRHSDPDDRYNDPHWYLDQ